MKTNHWQFVLEANKPVSHFLLPNVEECPCRSLLLLRAVLPASALTLSCSLAPTQTDVNVKMLLCHCGAREKQLILYQNGIDLLPRAGSSELR